MNNDDNKLIYITYTSELNKNLFITCMIIKIN